MTCHCGGKFVYKYTDRIKSDIDAHKIEVIVFICEKCGKIFLVDKQNKPRPRGRIMGGRDLPKRQPHVDVVTVEEKKWYEEHSMSDQDLILYMKEVKKHTKEVLG